MIKPKKGILLISEPSISDLHFFRSVILLVLHNNKETIGFVLNQPTKIKIHHLIKDFPESNFPIYIGGPVERDSLHYVHTVGDKIKGSEEITNGLFWGGDFDDIKILIENKKLNNEDIRFFAGYSGWTEGQLISEIKDHSWITVSSDKESCMKLSSNKELWSSFIKKMDTKYAIWTNLPKDPFLN